ncbi:MAG: hypothetical protein R3E10_18730 [Gemmatimonadota bacterium]
MNSPGRNVLSLVPLLLATLMAACTETSVAPDTGASPDRAAEISDGAGRVSPSAIPRSTLRAWIGGLRQATLPYRSLAAARAAGFDARLTDCMESSSGGMGVHWGDLSRFDGVVEELRPEILLYEPQPSGAKRLVAVEYAVPFTAWTADAPPELNGVAFHRNNTFGLWILHVWAWKENPSGALQDWNPRVTCRWAD